ncbi:hypothetical protein NDU88_002953 [Pleurodeles waltl]|uniref:Uncharacterized protein n=1 Tax=Pleurodeles waltl TaxID=8319 RepID=A0AAV7PB88_PLEWA|nr:hypothetical protein NDU88_002953 [Pleurodeles waltl]
MVVFVVIAARFPKSESGAGSPSPRSQVAESAQALRTEPRSQNSKPPSGILLRRRYRVSGKEPQRVAARSRTPPKAARARTRPQSLGTVCASAPAARPRSRVSVLTAQNTQQGKKKEKRCL